MNPQNKNASSIKAIDIEEIKKFVSDIKTAHQSKEIFRPERLQNMRDNGNFSRKYGTGISN